MCHRSLLQAPAISLFTMFTAGVGQCQACLIHKALHDETPYDPVTALSLLHDIKCLGGRNTSLTCFTALEFAREPAAWSLAWPSEMSAVPSGRNNTPTIFSSKCYIPYHFSAVRTQETSAMCVDQSMEFLTPVVPQTET